MPLNSALFCQDDNDYGKLWLGRSCIDAATEAMASVAVDLKIALIHHPLDWLHDAERAKVKASLRSRFDLILHGHLHETNNENVVGVAGDALHMAAGASYQTRQYPNRALYCTFQDNQIDVFPIRFEDKPHPQWVVDPSIFPEDKDYIGSFPIPRLSKV